MVDAGSRQEGCKLGWVLVAAAVGLAVALGLLGWGGGRREACWMGGILAMAVTLWLTEAVPLFVTSLWVVLLETLLLANPGGWPGLGFEAGPGWGWTSVVGAALDPVLVLFAGGLVLARSLVKEGVDRVVAARLLRWAGGRPALLLLGVMLATSFLGMWMSNTATASLMLALVGPMRRGLAVADPLRKALVLGVAFAANLSGLGTPVASPPNAVAAELLRAAGHGVSFWGWMKVGMPLSLGLTLLAWAGLCWRHPASGAGTLPGWEAPRVGWRGAWVAMVFAGTAALWMTDGWHGMPAATVALGAWALLGATGVFTSEDLGRVEWRVLMLMGGGLALGAGVRQTGLGAWLLGMVPWGGSGLLAGLVLGTFAMSTFMSSTAAANVMLPLAMAGAGGVGPMHPVLATMGVAMASSMAMALPASTPPNALAHAEGEVSTGEMARASWMPSVAGLLAILVGGAWWWRQAGLMP